MTDTAEDINYPDMKYDGAADTATPSDIDGPGALLKKEREARHLEIIDVADHLRLSKSIIESIEQDDYHKLPGIMFVRGYLRSYARFLDLPADEIIAGFNALGFEEQKEKSVPEKIHIKPAYLNEKIVKIASYGFVLLLVIALLAWWHNHSSDTEALVSPNGETTELVQPNGPQHSSLPLTNAQKQTAHEHLQKILPTGGAVSKKKAQ